MDIFYYIPVGKDYRSKLRSKTAKGVIKALNETFARHGMPQTTFKKKHSLMQNCKSLQLPRNGTLRQCPIYPQSNGQVEEHAGCENSETDNENPTNKTRSDGRGYDYVHLHGVCIGNARRSAVPLPPNRSEMIENIPGHDLNTNLCPYLNVVRNSGQF